MKPEENRILRCPSCGYTVDRDVKGKTGEKADYDMVVRYLLSRVARDEQLFRQACAMAVIVDPSRVRAELRKGRAEDKRGEEAFEAKPA